MSEDRSDLRFHQIQSYGHYPQNLLVNPGFEIWQRGAGPFTTDNTFHADELKIVHQELKFYETH